MNQKLNSEISNAQQPKGLVFDVMRYSLHDGPGLRTTVFLKGCPLNCRWCHNPESQAQSPEVMFAADRCVRCGDCLAVCTRGAIQWQSGPVRDRSLCDGCEDCAEVCPSGARQQVGRWMSVSELLKVVERDAIFFDESGGGVTFSGGEPLSQAVFLEAVLDSCREAGIHTAVDTCGFALTDTMLRISRKADLFLFDLKVLDAAKHRQVTGVSNDLILDNLSLLARQRIPVIVRIPVVPTVNDDDENVNGTLRFLAALGLFRVDLLPYHQIGIEKYDRLQLPERRQEFRMPTAERMEAMANQFKAEGFSVRIGG